MWDVRLRRPHPIPHWKEETSFLQFDQVHLLTAHGLIVTGSMDYYDEEEGSRDLASNLSYKDQARPYQEALQRQHQHNGTNAVPVVALEVHGDAAAGEMQAEDGAWNHCGP